MITNPLTTHHNNKNNLTNGIPRTIRKRTHITASQIASLQASFATNSLPDSSTRHALALSLGITERTVQIWFQNRRAKARKMDEKLNNKTGSHSTTNMTTTTSTATPSTAPRYQATFRSMMTPELFEEMKATQSPTAAAGIEKRRRPRSASKPEKLKSIPMVPLAPRAMSEETEVYRKEPSSSCLNAITTATTTSSSSAVQTSDNTILDPSTIVSLLPVQLLRIGVWTRFASTTNLMLSPPLDNTSEWGLVCYCTKDQLIWQIQAQGQQFRIHLPLPAIQQLSFGQMDTTTGQLIIQLDPQQLMFTMCLNGQQWVRCGDFSQDQQASQMMIHEIQGNHDLLQQSLLALLATVPELAPKFNLIMIPSASSPLLLDDLCRDFTLSPSATPEPSFMMMNGANPMYPNHPSAIMDKSMMLQAPFYYYPSSFDDQQIYDQIMML
ncbi:hypothetical protein BC941DRAFT_507193 [Chlamydoabsidia padenii]|nr:hypothetical protein BC941DRAFT_507193 [Chlamydoabsidia padenii]